MASPNIKTGYIPQGTGRITLARGSGATREMVGVNGVRDIEITRSFDSVDIPYGETMTTGKQLSGSKIMVKFTAGGWNSDVNAFINGWTTSTAGATNVLGEAVAVTGGSGTLAIVPISDVDVIITDANGDNLTWVESSPGALEYTLVAAALTVGGTPTATYYADYSGVAVAGLKSVGNANLPCEIDGFFWSPAGITDGACASGTDRLGIAATVKNMVIDGDITLLKVAKDNDGANEYSFTANIRNPATDIVFFEPEAG